MPPLTKKRVFVAALVGMHGYNQGNAGDPVDNATSLLQRRDADPRKSLSHYSHRTHRSDYYRHEKSSALKKHRQNSSAPKNHRRNSSAYRQNSSASMRSRRKRVEFDEDDSSEEDDSSKEEALAEAESIWPAEDVGFITWWLMVFQSLVMDLPNAIGMFLQFIFSIPMLNIRNLFGSFYFWPTIMVLLSLSVIYCAPLLLHFVEMFTASEHSQQNAKRIVQSFNVALFGIVVAKSQFPNHELLDSWFLRNLDDLNMAAFGIFLAAFAICSFLLMRDAKGDDPVEKLGEKFQFLLKQARDFVKKMIKSVAMGQEKWTLSKEEFYEVQLHDDVFYKKQLLLDEIKNLKAQLPDEEKIGLKQNEGNGVEILKKTKDDLRHALKNKDKTLFSIYFQPRWNQLKEDIQPGGVAALKAIPLFIWSLLSGPLDVIQEVIGAIIYTFGWLNHLLSITSFFTKVPEMSLADVKDAAVEISNVPDAEHKDFREYFSKEFVKKVLNPINQKCQDTKFLEEVCFTLTVQKTSEAVQNRLMGFYLDKILAVLQVMLSHLFGIIGVESAQAVLNYGLILVGGVTKDVLNQAEWVFTLSTLGYLVLSPGFAEFLSNFLSSQSTLRGALMITIVYFLLNSELVTKQAKDIAEQPFVKLKGTAEEILMLKDIVLFTPQNMLSPSSKNGEFQQIEQGDKAVDEKDKTPKFLDFSDKIYGLWNRDFNKSYTIELANWLIDLVRIPLRT